MEDRRLLSGLFQEYLPPNPANPVGIVMGPDHALWISENGYILNEALTPGATPQIFQPAPGSDPVPAVAGDIIAGAHGDLWFTGSTAQQIQVAVNPIVTPGIPSSMPLHAGGPPQTITETVDTPVIGHIDAAGVLRVYPAPPANQDPFGLAIGADGNLWFTQEGQSAIGRMSLDGTYVSFAVPDNVSANSITRGPDGNLWFTTDGPNVGVITPAGAVRLFPLPNARANLNDITLGADGNLWFTDATTNAIGRITPGGAVTEFPVPTANGLPFGITSGPDGNLWFTEQFGNAIGRITPAGVVTEYAIPNSSSNPLSITPGADGNLWFTENGRNEIGAFLLNSAAFANSKPINEFPVPTDGGQFPAQITVGPDHELWYTENTALGEISTGGVAKTILSVGSNPAASDITAIAPGVDGTFWYSGVVATTTTVPGRPGYTIIQTPFGPIYVPYPPVTSTTYTPTIFRLNADGTTTHFTISEDTSTFGLATAGDGTLWIAESNGPTSRIGRIAPDGTLTEFTLPDKAAPIAITAGPDGNFWFTETDSEIGRITPAGVVTDFTVPGGGFGSITAGPDGNLWFTDITNNAIGRITPSGVVTEFPVPTPFSRPNGITTGADGNLWFVEEFGNKVGRITPAGVVTEYAIPTAGAEAVGITAGPDGNLWFTEGEANQVGEVVLANLSLGPSAPVYPLTGALEPGSDSGRSHSDDLTNVKTPAFEGTAYPNAVVRLYAQGGGQAAPVLIGQTTASASGAWTITSQPLADGSYTITAASVDAAGNPTSARLLPSVTRGALIVDTTGPRILGVSLRPRHGQVSITFADDLSGIDQTTLMQMGNYGFRRGLMQSREQFPITGLTTVSSSTAPNAPETVTLTLAKGHPLGFGLRFELRVASGGVKDMAGNSLAGTFAGTFPTGRARAGGTFQAWLRTDGRHVFKTRALPRFLRHAKLNRGSEVGSRNR